MQQRHAARTSSIKMQRGYATCTCSKGMQHGCSIDMQHGQCSMGVLDTKSQNIPEVVLVRRGAGGALGIWEGGSTG
jgi:hypothetical protein